MRMPMMNNHMTPTQLLHYLRGGSCISLILQTNGTEATVIGQSHQSPGYDSRKQDHVISFPVQKSIELFGITVDDRRCFDEHVSNICKEITNQFNVISRFRKLIPAAVLLRPYKAFILPHFLYCSTVWHFCDSQNKDKLEMLNKRIIR